MIHDNLSNQIACQLKDSVFCNRHNIVKIVLAQNLESLSETRFEELSI